MENSLRILSDSLDKKMDVLRRIQNYNREQEKAFTEGRADLASFDRAIEEKDALIEELMKLDDGFEALFERISGELKENKQAYAPQIAILQKKISEITELSVSIQAQEARNKKLVEEFFSKERSKLGNERKGSKAAYDYYKSMSGGGMNVSRFMDQKN